MNGSAMPIRLASNEISYLQRDNWTQHQDVYIKALSGKEYGFNRCMLASLSWFCKDLFLEINECPLANLDEKIHVSSDFTEDELEALRDFFLTGSLPQPSKGLRQSFLAIGLDLQNLIASFQQSAAYKYKGSSEMDTKVEDKVEVKMEVEGGHSDNDYFPDLMEQDYEDQDYEEDEKPLKPKKAVRKKASKAAKATKKLPAPAKAKVKVKKSYDPDPKKKEFYFFFPETEERDLSKPYQCERCTRGFKDAQEYRYHFHRHDIGGEDYSKAFVCDKCENYECELPKELAEHRKNECQVNKRNDAGGKFNYFCAICHSRYDGYKDLLSHHREMHAGVVSCQEEVLCRTCGATFVDRFVLKRHFQKEGPFHENAKCAFCPEISFSTWKEHKDHLDKCHNGVLKFPCGFCGINYFNTKLEMSNHKTICRVSTAKHPVEHFPEGKHIACTICLEKVENNLVDVRTHLKDAHSALGEPCTICKEIFFSKKGMVEHMKTMHLKKLQCDRCDKVFSTSGKLRDHQISHEDARDFSKSRYLWSTGAVRMNKIFFYFSMRGVRSGFPETGQSEEA